MSTYTETEIEQRRAAVRSAYHGTSWVEKVDKMGPEQITAVYLRLKAQNKI